MLESFDKVSSTVSHRIAYLILEAFCMLTILAYFSTIDAFLKSVSMEQHSFSSFFCPIPVFIVYYMYGFSLITNII